MATIFGLDLSLTSTGLSGAGQVLVIRTKTTGPERLDHISKMVLSTIQQSPDPRVVIEGYSFASRNSQAHAIGELGGVVRLTLWQEKIPYVDVPPTVRAKFATGRGNAAKGEVMSAISARTGITWSGAGADDMCDAWILEEIGLHATGQPRYEWPKNHTETLNKIDWSPLQ